MAGQLLLINPRRRRKAAKTSRRRKGRMPAGLARYWASKRASNPRKRRAAPRRRKNAYAPALMMNPRKRRARRHNPIFARRRTSRRHRNPIALGGFLNLIKDAAIQSVGSVGMDYAFGKVNAMLPATLQNLPGTISAGDAVKVLFNVVVGKLLSKPTKGLSEKAALGSMTIHFRQMIETQLPASITSGLAWYQPAPVITGTQWTGPNRGWMARQTPLLSAFTRGSPTLSGLRSAPGMPLLRPNVVQGAAGVPIK
jgi:hypothetical protein